MKGFEGAGQPLGETEIWNMERSMQTPFLSIRGSSLAWGRGDMTVVGKFKVDPAVCWV